MKQTLYELLVSYIVENQNKFYRVAYSYARNQEDALDIVQNAVCKALESYKNLRNADAVKTWFYRILINESLAAIKQRKKELLSDDNPQKEEAYYEKGYEQQDDIKEELDRLEEDIQTIIRLRFFEELSLNEISEITGLNLNTVKTKLYRGLKLLRENIQEVS
ncbi:MAG TPA: sigma-70 family RNA polymerase sigma factor [Lacrimispora saccharolytica]|nr:sigma-70 family RNA polymerase sigma factor [Lacrimispora saccharolytica]